MLAIERTTRAFVASVKDALPGLRIQVERSKNDYGRSNYVYIFPARGYPATKVRISDHPIGMRRAFSGQEDLYIHARSKPDSWAVWLGTFKRNATPGDPHG